MEAMNDLTHVDKLVSGVEFEVKELIGKHQRLLTSQDKGNSSSKHAERLNDILASVVVRVGTETNIDKDFIKSLLACDKKKILTVVRQFTMEWEESFGLAYPYTDSEGKKQVYDCDITLEEGGKFPETKIHTAIQDPETLKMSYEVLNVSEYDKIEKEVTFVLPRSKKKVRFTMLDGKGEEIASTTSKSNRSSHTVIEMRRPVTFFKKDAKATETPMKLTLDSLAYKDIEFLRTVIKNCEGRVDTEIRFEHPDADNKSGDDKDVVLDVVGTVAFFFPSGSI